MSKTFVLFIQGGGKGAHAADTPLARSLQRALGPKYDVRFPVMPGQSDPNAAAWKRKIASTLSRSKGDVILVAHSIGGAILLRYLCEGHVDASVAAVYLLAVPSRDDDRWNFADLQPPPDLADKLAAIPRIRFYHCRDDEIAPFAHLAMHGTSLPRATTTAFEHGGHQFANDLSAIAADIRADDAS